MNTLLQCPYCDDEVSFHVDTIPGMQDVSSYTIPSCPNCRKPVVIETRRTTTHTPRRVEGIESPVKTLSPKFREFVDSKYKLPDIPTKDEARQDIDDFIDSLPAHACSKCERGFHAENPPKIDGDIVCSDCHFDYNKMCKFNPDMPRGIDGDDECIKCPGCDMVYSNVDAVHETELCPICRRREENVGKGTHPDPEQYHCQECGLLYQSEAYCHEYGMCKECAEHSDFKELAGRVQNTKPEYVPLPDSRTVSYCIDGDIIKLQYKGNDCNSYTFDVVWDIVDSPKPDWMSRIDEMLEGEKNHIQKASALNQLCKAVSKGTVKIPGSDGQ